MKLEKTIVDMSMFEKKSITLKDFKEKLLEYKKLSDKFFFWEYTQEHDKLTNNVRNYMFSFLFGLLPSVITLFTLMNFIGNYAFLVVLLGNLSVIFFLRNLNFGILKSRYKKWQILRKEIKNILNNESHIFSLLIEAELKFKNLKQSLVQNEELDNQLTNSIKRLIEDMKEDFANCQTNPDKALDLIDKIDNIERYQESIMKNIKSYQLKTNYIEYKKAHGLIEEDNEREILENKMVNKFKAIL